MSATLSCKDSSSPTEQVTPTVIQMVSGNNQEAIIGSELANPLMVEVLDAKGRPVGGQQVSWATTMGGGEVSPTSSVTNASGTARAFLRVGSSAGENRVSASLGTLAPVVFKATARARTVAQVVIVSGNGQTGAAGSQLADPIVVRAVDGQGQAVAGASVTFSITSGGGQLSVVLATTDANGLASTRWTLGSASGAQSMFAAAGAVGATITATASAVAPSSRVLSIVDGDNQTATVSTTLTKQLVVRVVDGNGAPVPAASVSFTASGGQLTPSSVATDGNGEARTSWRLGTTAGQQNAYASVAGASAVTFTATAQPGAPTQLAIVGGNSQVGYVSHALPLPLAVEVRDAFGNATPGTTVTFSVTSGGGSVTPTTRTADEGGRATTTWTLGSVVGAQGAVATVAGIGNAVFTATATRPLTMLTHRIVDAEFDTVTNRIVSVSADPSRLHVVNPETGATQSLDLPQVPATVSVQPDGKYAAVGHNGWISYVNLTTLKVERVYSISIDVLDVILPGNGYIYAFPRRDQWTYVFAIQLSNGAESHSAGYIYAGTVGRLHPSGKYIYGANRGLSPSDFEKYDIRGGTPAFMYDSPYHGDYAFNGDVWISGDGLRLFAKSGNVFRASEVRADDMKYAGNLSGMSVVQWVTHPSGSTRVLALPGSDWQTTAASELRVYGSEFLAYRGNMQLPRFILDGTGSFRSEGQFVFTNSSATRVYVLVRAEGSAGLANDWGIASYDMTELP
ncbi:MAG TPA: Ig-like domain-containing protein [Gemmatimonadaceae bacterium]|nr:Ig-like domain-containing protein [Gemmatimonadaceae bacterium]